MANPNILNSTSVKYHSLDVIIDKQLFTPSSSLTSDYQTKNIVLRNNTNSGKVFKITRIAIGNQQVSNLTNSRIRTFTLTYITDYTDSSIGDTAYYSSTAAPLYGEARITFIREQDITSSKDINTVSVLPSTSSTSLFQNSDHFYLKEGAALECYASASGYSSSALATAEYYRGRARIFIDYEEYEA